jgi:hypothetical protein
LLVFCVGLVAAQIKAPAKASVKAPVKKREGENRWQRNVLLTAPYQYEVPKKQLALPIKVPINDYSYYTSHDLPIEGKNFQYNSGPVHQQQSYYDSHQGHSLQNPYDAGFSFQGFEGFPQFQNSYNQLGGVNKLAPVPVGYPINYNIEKYKPTYQSFAHGNAQPFYNVPQSYPYNFNAFPTQQAQYAFNSPYALSHPQAVLPHSPIKAPDYAIGYKGLSHFSSTSPAPVYVPKGLNNHATYAPQSSSVVSYSHNHKHPSKYNTKPIYEQTQLHTSFKGTAQKPFRASVQVLNPEQSIYDSYGDQSITNEKPLSSNEYSLNQYAPAKQYLPAQVTEYTATESESQSEKPVQYLSPTKAYQIPIYQTPHLPLKVSTEVPSVTTANYYTTKSPYQTPSNQYLPASSQSQSQSYTPHSSSQYIQYTSQLDDSNQQHPSNEYYSYDGTQQQAQYVKYIPQDSTTKK